MKPKTLTREQFSDEARERFWRHVETGEPNKCWPWSGYWSDAGYGQFRASWGAEYAHRVAFAIVRGSTPDGLTLDHLCRNKRCCNPDHLEPVSQSVNIKRWWAQQDTSRCECGAPRGKRTRRCAACHNAYHREYRRRQ